MAEPPITIIPGPPSGMGVEAEALVPIGARCAVIEWPMPPDEADANGIPAASADILCAALLRAGSLAFRWDDTAPPPSEDGTRYFPAPTPWRPPRSWLGRLLDAFRLRDLWLPGWAPHSVLTTSHPAIARLLAIHDGWTVSQQAVIAYDPAITDPLPITAALQEVRDWRRHGLPPGARLLFGLGHDGGFGVAAAPDPTTLRRFTTDLQTA
ncbi:MAG TPA: hypothetical protein VGM87_10450 [Roseomonas sp.]|jgi:hypothetical protein